MKKLTRIAIGILIIINISLIAYALINYSTIPINGINPEENKPFSQSFNLLYPPQTIGAYNSSYVTLSVEVQISAQSLTTGSPVEISAIGTYYASRLDNISSVFVGFAGALPYELGETGMIGGGNAGGVSLYPSGKDSGGKPIGFFFDSYLTGEDRQIKFSNPQSYSLMLTIVRNDSSPIEQITYPSSSVYVISEDALNQPRLERANTAVGLLTLIDILSVTAKLGFNTFKKRNQP